MRQLPLLAAELAASTGWLRQVLLFLTLILLTLGCAVGSGSGHPPGATAAPIGDSEGATTLELDSSFSFRFECPPEHGDTFALVYLPTVWRRVNDSLNRLSIEHQLARCAPLTLSHQPTLPSRHSCLTVEGPHYRTEPGAGGIWLTVHEIGVQLHGHPGQAPQPADRAAFTREAGRTRAAIEAIDGIRECARINVTAWSRREGGGDCELGADCRVQTTSQASGTAAAAAVAAIIVAAALTVAILSAVIVTRRCQMLAEEATRQRRCPPESTGADSGASAAAHDDQRPPQLRARKQQHRRTRQSDSAILSSSAAVGLPLAASADRLGWLNLAYLPDTDPLPSRPMNFRGGDPLAGVVPPEEAAGQFARLGRVVTGGAGDPSGFYQIGESFVLAVCNDAAADADAEAGAASTERLLDLIWACGGVAVSLGGPDPAERLRRGPRAASGGRFHLTDWETRTFPCYSLSTASMHCLDTNLAKRLRVWRFTGRWDTAADAPASLAEFVRFATACADHLPDTAPAAALGSGLSAAGLVPLFLTAAEQLRRGGDCRCDLLRLAAEMRRQCPRAVASQQHYLFLAQCLQAYAFLLKRNSV